MTRKDDIKQHVSTQSNTTEGVHEDVVTSRDERDKMIEDPHNDHNRQSEVQSPFKILVVQVI